MIVSTPDLAVAKAALTAALLRSDPTPMARGPIEAGIEHIDRTLDKCSNPNVQECKNWIATNVVHSHGRTTALGKFLVALSESMEEDFDRPSVRKRRLHVLYIVSDVLHHVVVRQGNLGFGALWAVHLPDMVTAASFFDKSPKHIARVRDLLSIWEERKYIPTALLERLKECVTLASDKHSGYPIFPKEDDAATGAAKPPFTTPYIHGDPSLPWHEQPASCWLPLLKKGRGKPMRPEDVRPVTIHAGPNDDELDKVVDEVIALRHELWRPKPVAELADYDMNAMGQLIKPGVPEEKQVNYYGWTVGFCREMKKIRDGQESKSDVGQSRTQSGEAYSRSSRSPSPARSPKRRRASSRSTSRSSSPRPYRGRSPGRSRQRRSSHSRSPSPRRSRSHRRRSYSRSRSRSRSRKPAPRRQSPHSHPYRDNPARVQPSSAIAASFDFHQMPPQGPASQQFVPPLQLAHPVPPPPPPPPPMGYQGTWPPPPPPPPPSGWNPNQPGMQPYPPTGGPWRPGMHPPNGPAQSYNGHQQNWGRGAGRGGGGGGRGYRGRGRGGYNN